MTDTDSNKGKKLTIGSKLTLNKVIDESRLQKNIQGKPGSVTVVKKKKIFKKSNDLISENGSSSSKDKLANLDILKKAAEKSGIFKSTDLSSLNKKDNEKKVTESETVKVEEKITENIVSDIVEEINSEKVERKLHHKTGKVVYGEDDEVILSDDEKEKKRSELKPVKKNFEERRKSGKININQLSEDDNIKERSLASIRRAREKAKKLRESADKKEIEKIVREVVVPEFITVQELGNRMSIRAVDIVKELMKLGVIAKANQDIDADTAELIIETFGHKIKRVAESDVEKTLDIPQDNEENLETRSPVVAVMGHVDHGKTSLLDAIRSTDVAAGEAGGITQHIGAYQITIRSGDKITFLDTPGHEAFTAMRARGAQSTDIVILVVAADDGIKAQTIEAINHIKAAKVPLIVAVNKIDKEGADPQRVRSELLQHNLVPEEFGGDIMVVDVSAKQKLNLDKLEETILLQAEMLELKANPNVSASGVVIESKLDSTKGIVTTLLIQRGTLKIGDIVVAGLGFGKVKKILNDKGEDLNSASLSMPVEVLGFNISPEAGEKFSVVESEKLARDITEYRERKYKTAKSSLVKKGSLEDLFNATSGVSKVRDLPIIIKADVQGSLEAIIGSISKLKDEEINVKTIHTGVGGITQSDVILAEASKALIIGFNVRADQKAKSSPLFADVDIRYYSIIYDLVNDVKNIINGMLSPVIREKYTGSVMIKQVFNITKIGKIAGCVVTSGSIKEKSNIRLLRDNVVIYEGKLKALKRFKDEVKEVKEGQECGLQIENYEDLKENDIIEVFEVTEEKRTI